MFRHGLGADAGSVRQSDSSCRQQDLIELINASPDRLDEFQPVGEPDKIILPHQGDDKNVRTRKLVCKLLYGMHLEMRYGRLTQGKPWG